jgi:hypothetical protein
MNQFLCPRCGKASYTADTSQVQKCPYCVEKHVIVNNDFMDMIRSYNSGSLKLIINRRKGNRRVKNIPVEVERRTAERRRNPGTPIGWLLVQHPSLTT